MKPAEFIKKAEALGWRQVKGSTHSISIESPTGFRIPVSNHPSKDLTPGVIAKLKRLMEVEVL